MVQPSVPDKPNRVPWRLIADLLAFATALIGLVLALFAASSRDAAKNEAASLTDQLSSLDAEIASLSDERDRLEEELADSAASSTDPGTVESADSAVSDSYLTLEQAVATSECRDPWVAGGLQISGEEHFDAFSCELTMNSPNDFYLGYVDYLVPEGAERIVGLAGIDERSEDDTMTMRFTITSIADDDRELMSETMPYGDDGARFEVDVSGVNRVRLQVEVLSSEHRYSEADAWAGWAEVRFE